MNIYFPLRSNVDYRDLQPLELDLESRMKLSALLFEELIFENGVLATLIGRRLKFDLRGHNSSMVPPKLSDAYSSDRGVFEIEVNGVSIQDEAVRRYYSSFDQVLDKSGLLKQSWVRISDIVLTPQAEQAVASLAEEVFQQLDDGDEVTKVLRRSLIGHILYDQVLAATNNWELNLDPLHYTWSEQVAWVSNQDMDHLPSGIDLEVVFPDLPALGQITWEEILEVREHSTIREMRSVLNGVSREMRAAQLSGTTGMAIQNQLEAWSYRQLMSELPNLLPNRYERARTTGVSLAMNAIGMLPNLGLLTAAAASAFEVLTAIVEDRGNSRSLATSFRQRRDQQEKWNKRHQNS